MSDTVDDKIKSDDQIDFKEKLSMPLNWYMIQRYLLMFMNWD